MSFRLKNPLKFWQVDAFTTEVFKGNPAAVFILKDEISDGLMLNIAQEMNLAETAFVLLRDKQNPLLRWFTTSKEMDLCGHATLASAHILMSEIFENTTEVIFDTRFVGPLKVTQASGIYTMDFPVRGGDKLEITEVPDFVLDAIGSAKPVDAYLARDLMLVYDSEEVVTECRPDMNALLEYDRTVIITARSGGKYDFISRVFCPVDIPPEDPVTGSAHCTLAPYWSNKLQKTDMLAYQASSRGGELSVKVTNENVFISGSAITVISGKLYI